MCISKIICIDKGPCNREKNCQIGVRMRHKLFFLLVDAFIMGFLNWKESEKVK